MAMMRMKGGIVLAAVIIFSLVSLEHCMKIDIGVSGIKHAIQGIPHSLRKISKSGELLLYVPSKYKKSSLMKRLNKELNPYATVLTVTSLGISDYCLLKCDDCPPNLYAIVQDCKECLKLTYTLLKDGNRLPLFVAKLSDVSKVAHTVEKCLHEALDSDQNP